MNKPSPAQEYVWKCERQLAEARRSGDKWRIRASEQLLDKAYKALKVEKGEK